LVKSPGWSVNNWAAWKIARREEKLAKKLNAFLIACCAASTVAGLNQEQALRRDVGPSSKRAFDYTPASPSKRAG